MIKNISVAVLTKNNEDTITNTLNSLIEFEDVVVYDNGSKDKTMEIAKKFPNVNLVQGDFKDLVGQKIKQQVLLKMIGL